MTTLVTENIIWRKTKILDDTRNFELKGLNQMRESGCLDANTLQENKWKPTIYNIILIPYILSVKNPVPRKMSLSCVKWNYAYISVRVQAKKQETKQISKLKR